MGFRISSKDVSVSLVSSWHTPTHQYHPTQGDQKTPFGLLSIFAAFLNKPSSLVCIVIEATGLTQYWPKAHKRPNIGPTTKLSPPDSELNPFSTTDRNEGKGEAIELEIPRLSPCFSFIAFAMSSSSSLAHRHNIQPSQIAAQ
ncbi:hypothetical protein SDJN02_17239, partial [Cucurbita argyrosperma subsp. argyrosperma]